MLNTIEDIIDLMADYAAPYLFIGSGFSRRYINTPDWETLLRIIANKYGVNLNLLMLECKDETKPRGINYPKLGSKVNEKLEIEKVSADPLYDFRSITAIKEEIVTLLHNAHLTCDLNNPELLVFNELLSKVSGVITTNYDLLIERLTENMDYQAYIGQNSLITKNLSFSEEIYKIHGCVTERESLVISEQDYRKFENRQKYILGKLTVLFAEYPLIFIGYSVEDENIRSILKDLMVSLTYEELKLVSEKWLFVEYKKDEHDLMIKERIIELEDGSRLIFNCVETDNYLELYKKLLKINFRLPLQRRVIKYMKKMLLEYELKPNSKIFVQPSENIEEAIEAFKEGKTVSLSFGKTTVFLDLNLFDLMRDVIFEDRSEYNKETKGFVEQFKKYIRGSYYPRYRYFTSSELDEYGIDQMDTSDINYVYNKSINDDYKTSPELDHQLQYWLREIQLRPESVDIVELQGFLANIFGVRTCMDVIKRDFGLKQETNLKKVITAYDVLKNKNYQMSLLRLTHSSVSAVHSE